MTWRRFQVLLRGLSPNSATVTHLVSQKTFGKKKVHEVRGERAAQSTFESLFRPAPVSG